MYPHSSPVKSPIHNVDEKPDRVDQRLAVSTITVGASHLVRKLKPFTSKGQIESPICRSVEYGLRLLGLFPGTSFRILRRFLCTFLLLVVIIFQYQYLILHFTEQELSLLVDTLNLTLNNSLLFAKMVILICNNRVLNDTITFMDEDWKKRDVSDVSVMTRMAYVSRMFSNFIISLYISSTIFYGVSELITAITNPSLTRELQYKLELSLDFNDTSIYLPAMIIQYVFQVYADGMMSMLNGLIMTLILHVCGQIEILQRKISEVTREGSVPKDAIRTVIIRHQRIIFFSKNIETLFSYVALIQFLISTFVICFSAFLMVISIGNAGESATVMRALLFYMGHTMEVFFYCCAGEYISTKSKMIGNAAYKSLWYNLKPSENRDFIFLIMRSQKHITLTAGKLATLSFQQFATVVKGSLSYVSVLYAMY